MAKAGQRYRFRARDTIGAADAIEDRFFLDECFVDIGDIATLLEARDHRRIVLGRTGAGKTALLTKFSERENVITVKPEALSLDYITNSTIVPYLSHAGVKLDLFFRMLWRHVFALEFIRARFHIDDESAQRRFFDNIVPVFFKNPKHVEALEYFREWGGKFFAETETRVKEVTTKFQSDVETAIGAGHSGIGARLKAGEKLSEEERAEVVTRAQKVVNSLQMRHLSEMIDVLKHCFDDKQRFYIIIDRLDEYWVDDTIRYQLIRALIETMRDFSPATSLKIVIALRYDLLMHVFNATRDAGFQEEKYRSLYLGIKWTKDQLIELLDKRINLLVRGSYTGAPVSHSDILDVKLRTKQKTAIDYMLDRTFMRPRDVIQLINICIEHATDEPVITTKTLFEAEAEYSEDRLRSLFDEWRNDFPNLREFVELLRDRTSAFNLAQLDEKTCNEFAIQFIAKYNGNDDLLSKAASDLLSDANVERFRRKVVGVFFLTGLISVKTNTGLLRSYLGFTTLDEAEIADDARIHVHPMFWCALGIAEARKALLV